MNINLICSSLSLGRVHLLVPISLVTTLTFAQAPAIKGAKTDNNYANTTEINKTKGASDAQVLAEIEGDYGIGDVVRIVITTPKPVTNPLGRSGNANPSSINLGQPNFPAGQISPPINNLPAPQQPTTPPQYNNTIEAPITSAPTNNKPNNGQFTPINNRPAPQQTAAPKYEYEYRNSKGQVIPNPNAKPMNNQPNNGQFTPISNRPAPQQTATAAPKFEYEYRNSQGQVIPNPNAKPTNNQPNNGQFTPINNRPTPQQTATAAPKFEYEYRNSKGEVIPNPNLNKPNNPTNATPNIAAKTPIINAQSTTPMPTQTDLSNVNKKEKTTGNQLITNVEMYAPTQKVASVERTERQSNRSEKSASSGSSRVSKSSGFSFKNLFSGLGGSGFKTTKRRGMKSSRKYGCYRFN